MASGCADNLRDENYLIDAANTGGGLGIPTFIRDLLYTAAVVLFDRCADRNRLIELDTPACD